MLANKKLPPNFHERVIDLEHQLEGDDFGLETVNELMLLYSQAVEFYNGMNDKKYQRY